MTHQDSPKMSFSGLVKWFDPIKGFGFVIAEGADSDILLHANALRNYGVNSVCDGARITLLAQRTLRGLQAFEVVELLPPEAAQTGVMDTGAEAAATAAGHAPLEPARVKWFDKSKGFGFANVFGKSEDVFVHMEVLRRGGLADLFPGEAVALRIIDGERGRMATVIEPWELAVAELAQDDRAEAEQ